MQLDTTIAIIVSIAGLIAYLEFRVLPMLAIELPEPEVKIVPLEKTFICYYCGRRYPIEQQEKFGAYAYCKEHGKQRQESFPANGSAVKPAQPKSRQIKVPDQMPWEN